MLVLAGLVYTIAFLFIDGYLPQPYFYGGQSALTDWTVSAYFANNSGTYSDLAFSSVYPPLSFVFLRAFSLHACYVHYDDIFASRECDWIAPATITVFFLLNIPIVYKSFAINDKRTAWMRTVAICLGLPCVYAFERGNLIIPCFTAFVLGNSRVLKNARLKWLCQAISINFKPYLIMGLVGPFLRRRWRWLEGCAVMGLLIYLVTYALNGDGDPIEILRNIGLFTTLDVGATFERAIYASSYKPVTDVLASNFPLMHFIGSTPMEVMDFVLPFIVTVGKVGILGCFALTLLRPGVIPTTRLAALGISWILTSQDPGGYAVLFLFYMIFLERGRNPFIIAAIALAYLQCISFDWTVLRISHETITSYLTNRAVGYNLGVNIGELARPALVILVEYALIGASVLDVVVALRREWTPRAGRRPEALAVAPGIA